MKMIVSRTSSYFDDKPPVKGAFIEEVAKYSYRTPGIEKNSRAWELFNSLFTDIVKLPDGSYRGTWKKKDKVWVIEIDDILEFAKKVGEDVIVKPNIECVEGYIEIEIYDTYRE